MPDRPDTHTATHRMAREDFWQPVFDVTRRDDGTVLVSQQGDIGAVPRCLPDRLVHWATQSPTVTWLAERDARGDWRRLSYTDALVEVQRLAAGLLDAGLSPTRPLLILSENSIEHALLGLAAQYAGVPYAPLSTAFSLVSRDHGKLRDIVRLLQPGLVYAESGERYARALAAIDGSAHRVVVRDAPVAGQWRIDEIRQRGESSDAAEAARRAFEAITPATVAKYLFTSGSTGSPKAVINTQAMLCSNQVMVADCFRFLARERPVVVDWAPWSHTASGNKIFNMVLFNGGTFHIDDGRPTPDGVEATIRNLREVSPTFYFNVPVAWNQLVQHFERDAALRERFFQKMKVMMYAGAGMAQHTWDAVLQLARDTVGHDILLTSALGATETGPFAFMCTEQFPTAGNIGVPARGITLKLVPNGDKLEARLKSPSITPGYFGDAVATAVMLDEEGFYRLGDALRPEDPKDFSRGFRFDGRTAENFKLATGTWVAVGALRSALVNHFGGLLRDAVIVGEGRDWLGAIVLPDVDAMRRLIDEAAGAGDGLAGHGNATKDDRARISGTSRDTPWLHPLVKRQLQARLDAFAEAATGSSTRIRRLVVLPDAPSLDRGEVTDKGSVNQRAVIRARAALVEALYAETVDGRIVLSAQS